jgi:hypothetical protein
MTVALKLQGGGGAVAVELYILEGILVEFSTTPSLDGRREAIPESGGTLSWRES